VSVSDSSRLVPPELQDHDLVPGNLTVGIRLWAGATIFFFLGPFFAYLYLGSLNSVGQWRPADVGPPQALGAATMVLAVASSVALVLAGRAFGGAAQRRWLPLGWLALVLGLGSVALQVAGYLRLGFGPADGGYASVYVAWTGLTALFTLGTMVWLETLLAYGQRSRDQFPGSEDDPRSPSNLIRPRLAALAFYWAFLATLGVVMWILLYLA
jgi:heme/copper-type cytochrome/quinol oxidase subunit 3